MTSAHSRTACKRADPCGTCTAPAGLKNTCAATAPARQGQQQQPARSAPLHSRPGRRAPQQRTHLQGRRGRVPGQERGADGLQAAPVDGGERHIARHGRACRPARRHRSCPSQTVFDWAQGLRWRVTPCTSASAGAGRHAEPYSCTACREIPSLLHATHTQL